MSLIQSKCIFLKFHYTGQGAEPPPPSFLKIKFYFKNTDFYNANQCIQEGTKINTEVNQRPLKNIWGHIYFRGPPVVIQLFFV